MEKKLKSISDAVMGNQSLLDSIPISLGSKFSIYAKINSK